MKRVSVGALIMAIVISLLAGGTAGFFLGLASTKAGASFLEDLVEQEEQAQTTAPWKLVRERFELLYPSNWKIDADDEDYNPDQMFSIESPGAAYVMFILGEMETTPEETLQIYIENFTNLLGAATVDRFEDYGKYQGKGASLQGSLLGTKVTIKTFVCNSQGMTAIVVQQYPDEDLGYVKDGLRLIEESFELKLAEQVDDPKKTDATDSK